MEMNNNFAATYAFYDRKGRRLACFCRFITPTQAEIFIITCSLKDQFSRRFARDQYNKYLNNQPLECHPEIKLVTIQAEDGEARTMFRYCQDNFLIKIDYPIDIQVIIPYGSYESLLN